MTNQIKIHATHPQQRLIQQAVNAINSGGVVAYPTDSAYALGCQLGNKEAIDRIRHIRKLDKAHNFTLMCRDLSEISMYARVDNPAFRLLKAHTPGPYTFILLASKEVPRRLQHPKRKTIGIRIPNHPIAQALLATLNSPLMSVTLMLPGRDLPLADADEIYEHLHGQIEVIIDGGSCGMEPTTVIDLTSGVAEVIRVGKGSIANL